MNAMLLPMHRKIRAEQLKLILQVRVLLIGFEDDLGSWQVDIRGKVTATFYRDWEFNKG